MRESNMGPAVKINANGEQRQRGNPGKRSRVKAQRVPRPGDERDYGDDQRPHWYQHDVRRAPAGTPLFCERMRCKPKAWNRGIDAAEEPCRGKQGAVHENSLQFTVTVHSWKNCRIAELRNCRIVRR